MLVLCACVLRSKLPSKERVLCTHFLPDHSCKPGEELAELVVGNDSGMYKAGSPGDDAPRAVPSDARHDGWYGPEGRKTSGITHSTTNLKNIPFCPRTHDADHV